MNLVGAGHPIEMNGDDKYFRFQMNISNWVIFRLEKINQTNVEPIVMPFKVVH